LSSLESMSLSRECLDIVAQHHEKLDGSGYPKGLKGDEICQNAKIAMVANVIDENSSSRPYKQALPIDVIVWKLRTEKEKYPQELVAILDKVVGFRHAS
jgi:HD-GYP domain-containing protein (c-di-GMP phosphodiesterase class II)